MNRQIDILTNGKVIGKIYTGSRLEESIGILEAEAAVRQVFLVYDRNVKHLADRLQLAFPHFVATKDIEATELNKNMDAVMDICSWLLDNGADRKALLLALGGGITTDMAGFAASIYKRGIGFAYIPTTLLAQVDAAIGGKTGVNFLSYKNMIGTIHQPEFTWLSADVLESLSRRDLLSGAAEMLKTFIIEDNGNYARAVTSLESLQKVQDYQLAELNALIAEAAAVKAGVVGRDQFESGERRKLNLGHTFAHAIEHLNQSEASHASMGISHGEAVAMGVILAARLSEELGICSKKGLAERMRNDFTRCGLRIDCPYSMAQMAASMGKDKKSEGGKVHFVLIRDIGDVLMHTMSVDEAASLLEGR